MAFSRLIILVHPGSLCGSFETCHMDWLPGWRDYARSIQAGICSRFLQFDGHRAVVFGSDFNDEIPFRPLLHDAVKAATDRFDADATEKELEWAAGEIWAKYRSVVCEILVTGCWCDENDGCAWQVFKSLQKLAKASGVRVELDPKGAYEGDSKNLEA
jgi:hypothetical protein